MEINKKIEKLRKLKGITQSQMAKDLNIAISAYGKIEKGKTQLTVDRLAQIAKLLGTDASKIMSLSDVDILVQELQVPTELELLKYSPAFDKKIIDNAISRAWQLEKSKIYEAILENIIQTYGTKFTKKELQNAFVKDPVISKLIISDILTEKDAVNIVDKIAGFKGLK